MDDKPYDVLPNWVEGRLKICVVDLFQDIKYFRDSKSVDRTPYLMDYIFKSLHLDDNDSISQKSMRSKLWVLLCKWIWKEINKMRSNKITCFYSIVKSK